MTSVEHDVRGGYRDAMLALGPNINSPYFSAVCMCIS